MRSNMRPNVHFFDKNSQLSMPVTFTGDAINHLSALTSPFNIREWVWHIETVNGAKRCIVTDKRQQAAPHAPDTHAILR